MADFSKEKQIIREFYAALDGARAQEEEAVLARYYAKDHIWRGFHPFNEQFGAEAVARTFWQPLRGALSALQRREDIFIAGANDIDDFKTVWVVSMGHLMGLFDRAWLGILPTGKLAMLRYCEFNRVENGRIHETALFFDIPHLMAQAGVNPFLSQRAANLVQPGPRPHDGIMLSAAPPEEGAKTLSLINAMCADIGQWKSEVPIVDELRRTWCENMLWWGPTGIGATYTIERYAKQHATPFRAAFSERSETAHICRLAEGHYGGFFGWPNFTATLTGDFMGMPPSGKSGAFRVIDMYRRAGDKLAENWVFIDLLHFWKQQGVDILAERRGVRG